MLVLPDERTPIARLLAFLEEGEQMAQACASSQATFAPELEPARFLKTQARQEATHARVFHGAILWLTPRRSPGTVLLKPLEAYRVLLEDALKRRDFLGTVLAEQIILEGLGESILTRIEEGLAKRGAPFGRMRRILLHQEEAHHAFGIRTIERALQRGEVSVETLRSRAADYLDLIEPMVTTLADLFDTIHEDAAAWAADCRFYLPWWLMLDDMPLLGPERIVSSPLTPDPSLLTR
ncbi:MAG: hypothetical protein HZB35_09135 [Nitrospirae bacterium]|nr:hypothetical protein [Nitrospirota bacterium]